MANVVLPRVQAMVLCDGVKESDLEAEVFQLAGVRTALEFPSFPASYTRLYVFTHMSGHTGQARCHVEIERGTPREVIGATAPRIVRFDHPADAVPVIFRFRNCEFPKPGIYYVQVYHEIKLIGERALHVRGEG